MSDQVTYDVDVTRGVQYGTGLVGYNDGRGPMRERALFMDVYAPLGMVAQPRPALVLAFGGAFHRGSREDDSVTENGHGNTPISEYCRVFAAQGYVCFSIDYRLTQEDPHPGHQRPLGDQDVPRSRVDYVRTRLLGLPPSTPEMMRRVQEAAMNDMALAYHHVQQHAASYGVDPSRVAVGGFSAGGRTSLGSSFSGAISPAAVICLSAHVPDVLLDGFEARDPERFPVFIGFGENDLDYIREAVPHTCERLRSLSMPVVSCMVSGGTHFYPKNAPVVCDEGAPGDLEAAIGAFLKQHLRRRVRIADSA